MKLFVYNWYYTGYDVYGHCLDEGGTYRLVKVTNYRPSCYVEGDALPRTSVVPLKTEYRRMATSRDVSVTRPFHRVFFRNMRDMDDFVSEARYRTYMADIPQITVFLSQIDVDHVGWIKIDSPFRTPCVYLEPAPPRRGSGYASLPKAKADVYEVEAECISAIKNENPYSSPKVMSFDIEVFSSGVGMPRPYKISDSVEMISVVFYDTGAQREAKKYILHTLPKLDFASAEELVYDTEVELIVGFFGLIRDEDPTVITGFNIFNFDIKYLVSRLQLRLTEIPDVSRGVNRAVDIIKVDWASDAYGHNKYDRLVIGGRIILDMYLYFKRMKLDKYSLDFISNQFLGESKNDMRFDDMMDAFRTKDVPSLRTVAEYCLQDSMLVVKLFDKVQMWIDACEISKITMCGIEDIYTRGEQMKMISQCVRECMMRNMVLQPQEKTSMSFDYEGAYVLEPVRGVYDNCALMDFQSLYPSIIIAFNICPSTYIYEKNTYVEHHSSGVHKFRKSPVGMLPGMIKRILDERKAVKALMKQLDKSSITYVVLDRRQNALKICANSVYGMMGFKNSRYFGHVGCAESVTAIGRDYLVDVVKKIEESYPVKVVYGDSVAGYTPTIVRYKKEFVFVETLENIAARWSIAVANYWSASLQARRRITLDRMHRF